MSMNTQRITISMPDYLYAQLIATVPAGQVSKFVSAATEDKIVSQKLTKKTDPVEHFLSLGNSIPHMSTKQILAAVRKGRK